MGTVYWVKDWDHLFENAESRKLKSVPRWVAIPNKHDGKGYRRLLKHPRCAEIFSAWILLVQIASKQPHRGILADREGPLTTEDFADATGFPADIFEIALKCLTDNKIGWICCKHHPDGVPVSPDDIRTPAREDGVEWKGMEGNGKEENTAAGGVEEYEPPSEPGPDRDSWCMSASRNWITLNCARHLSARKIKLFSGLIDRHGYGRACELVTAELHKPHVANPFAYVEQKIQSEGMAQEFGRETNEQWAARLAKKIEENERVRS